MADTQKWVNTLGVVFETTPEVAAQLSGVKPYASSKEAPEEKPKASPRKRTTSK